MPGRGIVRAQRAEVESLELLQDREDGGRAGRGRPHPADAIEAIGPAQGLALARLIGGEIVGGHRRRVALRATHGLHQRPGGGAGVEMLGAASGEPLQERRERRVADQGADRLGLAVGCVELGAAPGRRRRQRARHGQRPAHARRDRKAVAGEPDRGLEQPRPGKAPVPFVRHLDQADVAGHADAEAAGDGLAMAARPAVGAEEISRRRRVRRGLAAVIAGEVAAPCVMIDEEAAAADPRGLRLDHGQRQHGRQRRVRRAAAGAQDLDAGLRRARIGGRDHAGLCRRWRR